MGIKDGGEEGPPGIHSSTLGRHRDSDQPATPSAPCPQAPLLGSTDTVTVIVSRSLYLDWELLEVGLVHLHPRIPWELLLSRYLLNGC